MDGRRRFLLVVLGGLGLSLVSTVVLVGLLDFPADNSPCGNPAFRQTNLGLGLLGGCIASALIGRIVAYWLGSTVVIFDVGDEPQPAPTSNRAALWVQLGLVTFLALTAAGLAYETAAVWSGKFWAITQYIRCGAYLASVEALLIASFVSFLLGTWLWFPSRPWPPAWRSFLIGAFAVVVVWVAFQVFTEVPAGAPPNPLPTPNKWGIAGIAGAILGLCILLVIIDLVFARRKWDAIGKWVVNWTQHYPLWNALFALVFGAMIGHFFWK